MTASFVMYPIRLTDEANKNGVVLYSPFTNILKQNTNRIDLSQCIGKPTQLRYYVSGALRPTRPRTHGEDCFLKSVNPFFILVYNYSRSLSRKKEKVRYVD